MCSEEVVAKVWEMQVLQKHGFMKDHMWLQGVFCIL
jgi:hypothetical protein